MASTYMRAYQCSSNTEHTRHTFEQKYLTNLAATNRVQIMDACAKLYRCEPVCMSICSVCYDLYVIALL
jgi:hypothetical protein